MLLYDSPNPAPNPRRVRMVLSEKGVQLPTHVISLADGEQRSPAFLRVNPLGKTPVLELDDGRVLTESVAICRLLDALHPGPSLFGGSAYELAEIEMWTRRVELRWTRPITMVWLYNHPLAAAAGRPQFGAFGDNQRRLALAMMAEIDTTLRRGYWVTGGSYSIADIVLYSQLEFAAFMGLHIPDELTRLVDWRGRAAARPSGAA